MEEENCLYSDKSTVINVCLTTEQKQTFTPVVGRLIMYEKNEKII